MKSTVSAMKCEMMEQTNIMKKMLQYLEKREDKEEEEAIETGEGVVTGEPIWTLLVPAAAAQITNSESPVSSIVTKSPISSVLLEFMDKFKRTTAGYKIVDAVNVEGSKFIID